MKPIHSAVLAAVVAATAAWSLAEAQTAQPARPAQQSGGAYHMNVAEVCKNLNFYESLKVTVPLLLRLDDRQIGSWKNVESALTDARRPVETGCGQLKTLPASGEATAQAARLEVVLSSSLDALRRVRPSFDRFYATLNPEQRRQVDKSFENSAL
jgi:hypothetical protein